MRAGRYGGGVGAVGLTGGAGYGDGPGAGPAYVPVVPARRGHGGTVAADGTRPPVPGARHRGPPLRDGP